MTPQERIHLIAFSSALRTAGSTWSIDGVEFEGVASPLIFESDADQVSGTQLVHRRDALTSLPSPGQIVTDETASQNHRIVSVHPDGHGLVTLHLAAEIR